MFWAAMATTALGNVQAAQAACTPDPVSTGGSVTCVSNDTDGFSSNESGVALSVVKDSTVDGAGVLGHDARSTSIALGDAAQVTNDGTIYFNQANADFTGTALTVGMDSTIQNNGLIEVQSNLEDIKFFTSGIGATSKASIENDGTIIVDTAGSGFGIATFQGSKIVNAGTIDVKGGTVSGISASDSEVINTGTISVVSDKGGYMAGLDATKASNSGTITVTGSGGEVHATGMGGIPTKNTLIENSNIVTVSVVGDKSMAQGVVVGDGGSLGTIVNSGSVFVSLNGKDYWAAGLALDGSQVTATNTGSIKAVATGGADAIGILSRLGLYDQADVTNDKGGTIDSTGWGIKVGDKADVQNNGSITAVTGIETNASGDVRNAGTIDATISGMVTGDQTFVLNEGDIKITDAKGQGILAGTFNDVRNSGTISSNGDGIVADKGSSVSNTGSVVAVGDAIRLTDSGGTISNFGNLKGSVALLGGGGDETFINGGNVQGDILLGDGNDKIEMRDKSFIAGKIRGGDGVDTMTAAGITSYSGQITGIEGLGVVGQMTLELGMGSTIDNVVVNSGADLLFSGSLTGDINIDDQGRVAAEGDIAGNIQNAGTVEIDEAVGVLKVVGSYTQTATGEYSVLLGGTSGSKMDIFGPATLDGVLTTGLQARDLSTLEGKSYTVLTASSISGAFDTTGTVKQGFWTLDVEQTGAAITVTITDVNVPVGASVPFTSGLRDALFVAVPPQSGGGGGIEIGGDNNTVPIGGNIVATNEGVPSNTGRMNGPGDAPGDQKSASLNYDDMGDWETKAASFTDNWSAMGDRTPAMAMPKTGTAEFAGTTKGELTETASGTPEAFVVKGNVLLTANFASGLVNADFTDMEKIDAHGVAAAWVDFRARMSIADGTSEFAGTAGTDDGVWSGKAKGGFYGDDNGMPGHAAGLWSMSSPLGRALGGFMAKRQ
jgi:hypothetical protein